jgi:hypothetical protein
MKNVPEKAAAKNFDGTLATDGPSIKEQGANNDGNALKKDKKGGDKEKGTGQYGVNLNESDSVASGSASQRDSHRGLIDRDNFQEYE